MDLAPAVYTIRIYGHLGPAALLTFPALTARCQGTQTVLTGLLDQSALFGAEPGCSTAREKPWVRHLQEGADLAGMTGRPYLEGAWVRLHRSEGSRLVDVMLHSRGRGRGRG